MRQLELFDGVGRRDLERIRHVGFGCARLLRRDVVEHDGHPVPITLGQTVTVAGTVSSLDDDTFTDVHCGVGGGRDVLVEVEPAASGVLIAMIGRSATGTLSDPIGGSSDLCQPPNDNRAGCWSHDLSTSSAAQRARRRPALLRPAAIQADEQPLRVRLPTPNDNRVTIVSATVSGGVPACRLARSSGGSARSERSPEQCRALFLRIGLQ